MAKRRLKKSVKKLLKRIIFTIFIIIGVISICEIIEFNILKNRTLTPKENYEYGYYTMSDFGYVKELSEYDFNLNGNDDYTDILIGLKKVAKENPKYVSDGYYDGGYPPEGEGVCTDVIWQALMEAGYKLKDMIIYDIWNTYKEGTYGIDYIDNNIDFRRVGNQQVFFERYAKSLDTDYENLKEFQPGDIVVFNNGEHIAMISDRVNAKGIPYLIQNSDEEQTEKEEDVLEETDMYISSHYRFEYNDSIKQLIINTNKSNKEED